MNESPVTLEAIGTLIDQAHREGADLLVLPECAYPAYLLGSVESYRNGDHLTSQAFLGWLCSQAADHHLHIISGMVEDTGTHLYNTAVLVDDAGQVLGRTRKRLLWHLDQEWFTAGSEITAVETRWGKVGIIICAEGRLPEIMATLVAAGAELIAMPTCWINTAREPGQYANPQSDFLIEVRAREFGVPFVCADKSGLEMTTGYVGRSCIVSADGTTRVRAPATGQALIVSELELVPPPQVWAADRWREEIRREHPSRPARSAPQRATLCAASTRYLNEHFTGGMGEGLFKPLQDQGVRVFLSSIPQEAAAERAAMLARAFDIHATAFPTRVDVHGFGPARVGTLAGEWVKSFAASRALSLAGAELLLFYDVGRDQLAWLRTRALENRVFVMGAAAESAAIIGPDGSVLAEAGGDQPAVATVDLLEASDKNVAPRTDVFAARQVSRYRF